jgi:hypothetical protein
MHSSPAKIQDEFSAVALKENGQKAGDSWFTEVSPPSQVAGGKQALLEELDRLVGIYEKAAESLELKRHKAA